MKREAMLYKTLSHVGQSFVMADTPSHDKNMLARIIPAV
jgi:hypothetical protein